MTPVREALERLLTTAKLLQQNAEGCATNHYGHDCVLNGLPGWLIDTQKDIDAAIAALSAAPGEPCAWRWCWLTGSERDREWSMWTYSTTRPTNTTNKVVEPLYSTPQPAAGWDALLRKIEYATRKDSLTDHERIQSIRSLVCAEMSKSEVRREAPAPAEGVKPVTLEHFPAGLHPRTSDLVKRFAVALAKKLRLAEQNYGYGDGWAGDHWENDCCDQLHRHIDKGDPRDVAAYCAFMWHHGWITHRPDTAEARLRELLNGRDGFIVSKGLWTEFTDTLPRTPPSGGDEAKESEGGKHV